MLLPFSTRWLSSLATGLFAVQSSVASPVSNSLAVSNRQQQQQQQQDLSFSLYGAPPYNSQTISRSGWSVSCDSFQPGNECAMMIDGSNSTFWHTAFNPSSPPPPHQVIVDMGSLQSVSGISMTPRQDGNSHGWIASHQLFLSQDNKTWGTPVAFGTWYSDSFEKYTTIEPQSARYVKLVALSEVAGNPWTSIAELNVYSPVAARNTATGPGRWGATIDLPVVPVAAAVEPTTGRVLFWSSYREDEFGGSPGGFTLTATYDPLTGTVSQRTVSETKHDMFCPGISMGFDGQVIVTGGNNAEKTSIYNSVNDTWVPASNMVVARGYQASATLSDGRIFTIGGSWSGGSNFLKNGEVYTPSQNTWTQLNGTLVLPMMTNDQQGQYRADNHAWLFGWKNGTVFQAGPSAAMNWYTMTGGGGTAAAGKRSNDPDSMCGTATMYDAAAGKILAVGGSPNYQGSQASFGGHIITVGSPNTTAAVAQAGGSGALYNRIFHNSVVLPDGTVFITGGQQVGNPFSDALPQLTPELYDPRTDTFAKLASNSIVRVYHSTALLLPDATVFTGGGGLCGQCNTNHFDAQIFSPAYLFAANGQPATRPAIASVSSASARVGTTILLRTGGPVAAASLVRYATTTHTVNTDQRRVPLPLTAVGTNAYTFAIPSDPGVALPGYWMLFVLDSNGVPSNATTIKILP